MTEYERVGKNINIDINHIQKNGVQHENISLDIIAQATIEIAKELAVLNDYLKGENNGDKNN